MARTVPRRTGSRRTVFGGGGGAGGAGADLIGPIVDLGHPMFAASGSLCNSNSGSNAWVTSKKPVALAFFPPRAITITQLGWWNGSGTMTDPVDMGIYTSAWAKVVTTGSTPRTGASLNQWVDIADTPLAANTKYYLVINNSGTTANQHTFLAPSAIVATGAFLEVQDSATDSFPLPDPLAGMGVCSIMGRVPAMFMALRAVA